ncbi:YfdX family protein [Pseudaestuariivita atlantica]|uniref:YfdX family protein n=1 Tax=Pseudaestuariivita atlantica TaxID=1317121 RepID=A0A0L1JS80_9RHOB|nr:YfdX family protein [Pseudaestuariivita atlantica]KNG94596.1 hypothetical protein ATO11_04105 [Pseudaestuariivita atlantica]
MKRHFRIAALALATLMSSTSLVAYAGENVPTYDTQTEMLKTADHALVAITHARAARLALFDDDVETAKGRVAEARAEFIESEKELNDLTIGDTEAPEGAVRYLPFDMSMSLSETFEGTEVNKQALEKFYGLMQSGSPDDAVEVLRLAEIEVNVTAALLPITEASDLLLKAQTLIDEGKYFEANLALKAMEDAVIVRSFSIDAIPEQGADDYD